MFPENITTFIDMFMGSGAVTFAMVDRVKHIIANDNDDDVFNLFMVVKNRKDDLVQAVEMMPSHESLFKYWKAQQEHDPIWRAVRFLLLSNFGYMGKPNTFRTRVGNDKARLLENIESGFLRINHVSFIQHDFRDVLGVVSFRRPAHEKPKAFVYADPPYFGTVHEYQHSFSKQDTEDLFASLAGSGIRFAISEFDHPFVLDLAKKHGLTVTTLGERQNIRNRRTELLITNYDPAQKQVLL